MLKLDLAAGRMTKASKKSEIERVKDVEKVKTAIMRGDLAGAQIYGANAIRHKNEATSQAFMASQIEAMASKLKSQVGGAKGTIWSNVHVHGFNKPRCMTG